MSELRSFKRVQSVGGVHREVFDRAAALAADLEAKRAEAHGQRAHTYEVPGTHLDVRRRARMGQMPGALHEVHEGPGLPTIVIAVRRGDVKTNLLAVTEVPGPKSRPAGTVSGYQGAELGGHYWLSREPSGLVRVRLGEVTAVNGTEEEPLLGESVVDKSDRLKELSAEDSERLFDVVQGILANVTAVEMLVAGESPADALRARDYYVPQQEP